MKIKSSNVVDHFKPAQQHCCDHNSNRSWLVRPIACLSRLLVLCVAAFAHTAVMHSSAQAQSHQVETVRFFDPNGRPLKLLSSCLSPDGNYLALSFHKNGMAIVDIPAATVVARSVDSFSSLAFGDDSSRLLCVGGYFGGAQILDINARTDRDLTLSETLGRTGIRLEQRQGKLLITDLPPHLSSLQDTVRIGDELLAIRPGQKPILADDADWKTLLGKSVDEAVKLITGPPGTFVQLRVSRPGQADKLEFDVQRLWPDAAQRPRVTGGQTLAMTSRYANVVLRSAPTGADYAHVHFQYVKDSAQTAISTDARLMASVGELRSGRGNGLEIHDLIDGRTLCVIEIDLDNIQQVRFAQANKQLLIGTRDSIEVFDIADKQWQPNLLLVPEAERDAGEVVQRRLYGGFGFPGDLYIKVPEVVYSTSAALIKFAGTPSGTLAIASEEGKIVLASLEGRRVLETVGERMLEGPPELLEFSPDARYLIAYANGMLHIIHKSGTAN